MIATYGELKAHLAARLHGRDLSSLLPDFVRRAHDVIAREVHVMAPLTVATATPALPADFRTLTVLRLATARALPMAPATAEAMAAMGAGEPRCWRIEAGVLTVAPAPDRSWPATLTYQVSRAPFAADGDSNAVLARHPFAYVYGALAEIKRHLEDIEGEAKYEALFRAEIEAVNRAELGEAYGGPLQAAPAHAP